MDFQYYGANCIKVDINKASFLIDPSNNALGEAQKIAKKSHIVNTGFYPIEAVASEGLLNIDYPGEYEIDGVAIKGIQTRSFTDIHDSDAASNIIFTLRTLTLNLCVLGNPTELLSEEVYEQIGSVDILILPVGGGGFTIDAKGANKIIKQIEPNICIASHFDTNKINYEVPQNSYEDFFNELGSGELIKEEKLKIKEKDLSDTMQVFALNLS